MSRKANPKVIGAFVLGALTIAVVAVAVLGSGRLFRDTKKFVVYFDKSVGNLNSGAPVKFRGVRVGEVTDVRLQLPGAERGAGEFSIPVVIELDAERIHREGSRIDLDDPAIADSLIADGLRASLEVESVLTGVRFIALDIHPGSPVVMADVHGLPHPQLPTIETGMSQIQQGLEETIRKISEIEIDLLATKVSETVEGLNDIVRSPDVRETVAALPQVAENLNATLTTLRELAVAVDSTVIPLQASVRGTVDESSETLDSLQVTLSSLHALLEPGSPFTHKMETTLDDLAAASRSLRLLAQYLERDPSALLRGKEGQEE